MKQVKHIKVKNQMNRIICCDPMRSVIIHAADMKIKNVMIGEAEVQIDRVDDTDEKITVIHVKVPA